MRSVLGVGLVCVMGCVTGQHVAQLPTIPPPTLEGRQIMVECKMVKGGDILSAPKIITLSGREAEIAITSQHSIPGLQTQVETGIQLTINPVLVNGQVAFTGSYSIKEKQDITQAAETTSAAFITREMFFKGIAAPDEKTVIEMSAEQTGGEPIQVNLLFSLPVSVSLTPATR
ncbi:MAG: hypothetical protein CMO66_04155 [Verrucomicrobiales bacterium]|nr:hypothetical protein [Verrucomicrobiales bacterium]